MGNKRNIMKRWWLTLLMLTIGIGLLIAAFAAGSASADSEAVAARAGRRIERRLAKLDSYITKMNVPGESWTTLDRLPEDMVIYRYVCDTLQCWNHEFPVINDDIRSKMRYQWIARPQFEVCSPLNDITDSVSFVNLGNKWYLAKWSGRGELTETVSAIEICSSSEEGVVENINRHLGIPADYMVYPIAGNSGATVYCDGRPLFSIICGASLQNYLLANSVLRWLALAAFVLAAICLVWSSRRWREFAIACGVLILVYFIAMKWGAQASATGVFSPAVFAGAGLWSSFGALLCLSMLICGLTLCIFLMRNWLFRRAARSKSGLIAYAVTMILVVVGIGAYSLLSVRDMMENSIISIEPQWFRGGFGYTISALVMYGMLLSAVMLALEMVAMAVRYISGKEIRILTLGGMSLGALIFTAGLFLISSKMGFDKEQSRVGVWANRLSVERNLMLELQLRSIEDKLANDTFIPTFADMEEAQSMISALVSQQYFPNITADYYVEVSICSNDDKECNALFNSKLINGTQIAPGSRFFCNYDDNGRSSYAGTFMYVSKNGKLVRMLVEMISRASKEDNGYYSIFDKLSKPGDVVMPDIYSYAKYIDNKLASYKGTAAYPTLLTEKSLEGIKDGKDYLKKNRYIHFVRKVSDDETIIVSRPCRNPLLTTASFLTLFSVIFMTLLPLFWFSGKKEHGRKKSFKSRIHWTLLVTITLALLALAFVSIKFVFDRNRTDSSIVMTEKISAIQSILESRCQGIDNLSQVDKTEWMSLIQNVASTTKSDLNLYTPKGNVYLSTVGEMFDLGLLNFRINGTAYRTIIKDHQRVCINNEEAAGKKYYALYAPILGRSGQILAIACTPFNRSDALAKDAVPHAVLLLILLVAIIVLSSAVATHIIDKIFEPLMKVSSKMQVADTNELERVDYGGDDEISTLVEAYNDMVDRLEASRKILAQNERDKAWSAMARQVAHEIKNPLTPINLEIQKLMYLKAKNDPAWSDKFDNSARIILEHINILTDKANEFSTIAKLDVEDPVEMDLDLVLQDQITLFSNREGVEVTYLGFKNAIMMGPKPQLIRVFVNLLTNAVQSIENSRKEDNSEGRETKPGLVRVELRQDSEWYEISIEDNGPGVSEENFEKLFTPNFTTKKSGTGLGLVICRNIVEKCGGSISYKKSFTLEGACFTVRLPKTEQNA